MNVVLSLNQDGWRVCRDPRAACEETLQLLAAAVCPPSERMPDTASGFRPRAAPRA